MPTSTKTAADIIADAGRALFGDEHWRKPLAEALGVKPDTISAIMRGKMTVPEGMLKDLRVLVRVRANQLASVAADLDGIATEPLVKRS